MQVTISNITKGEMLMLMEVLIDRFKTVKNTEPLHANELLDFIQRDYINQEISIVEYKKLFFQLDQLKAEKPTSYIINNTNPISKMDLPG